LASGSPCLAHAAWIKSGNGSFDFNKIAHVRQPDVIAERRQPAKAFELGPQTADSGFVYDPGMSTPRKAMRNHLGASSAGQSCNASGVRQDSIKAVKNVLVIPSGTEIALEIHEALYRRRDLQLFGAESTYNSHADFVFRRNSCVPYCGEEEFIGAVDDLINQHSIDYLFPAHDDVQLALLRAHTHLRCTIVSSPLETVEITRFKSRTYDRLQDLVRLPALLDPARIRTSDYPVFAKPDRGHGSRNTYLCRNQKQLDAALQCSDEMLVSEYLPGREVTVDCLSDRDRGLLFIDSRLRARTRAGISVRSEPLKVPDVREIAEKIASRLRFFGAWFFQLRERRPGEWCLLEIGARLAGGATYQRLRGVNLPLLTLFEHERRHMEILVQPFELTMDRAFVSRFRFEFDYRMLYVDFDDTLCLRGEPNPDLVALVVVARHRGKKIVLLSRNVGDCRGWLKAHGIAGLFDEIILLDRERSKHAHIEAGSLLIDDSFAERKACQEAGVICFDADAAKALLQQLQRH
jgi:carbamoyl-phosphate synthase large subunit